LKSCLKEIKVHSLSLSHQVHGVLLGLNLVSWLLVVVLELCIAFLIDVKFAIALEELYGMEV